MATSSVEAELYAGNRAATESIGVQAFAKGVGRAVPIRLHIDSCAALSIISRTGLGKAKHVDIQHFWLQEAVRSGKHSGKDPHRNELCGARNEASHE